tara:strand:- start:1361 stop:2536 length:1176 start_codon:yes stop_codon:yes gene_type:complete
MITKVIYLGYSAFSEKTKSDFYFKELETKGIDVVYWDLSNIFFKGKITHSSYFSDFKTIDDYTKFREELKKINNTNTLFVTTISYYFNTIKLFYLLKKFDCKTAFFARGMMPSLIYDKSVILSKVLNLTSYPTYISTVIKFRIALLIKKLGLVKILDIIYYAGEESLKNFFVGYNYDLKNAKIYKINYFDYDKTKEIKNSKKIINNKYCLFHDEYLPFHPDFNIKNVGTVDSEQYFKDLNRFFLEIENKLNIQVVIAAHPKAKKYKSSNPFNHRKLFFSKTAELSKYSEFSIAHASTSVSYPVIYNKPVLFINSNQINNTMNTFDKWIECYANELNSLKINIDNYTFLELSKLSINLDSYQKYKLNYLISTSLENNSAQIFIESLNHIKEN